MKHTIWNEQTYVVLKRPTAVTWMDNLPFESDSIRRIDMVDDAKQQVSWMYSNNTQLASNLPSNEARRLISQF